MELTLRKDLFEYYEAKDLWKNLCRQMQTDPYAELITIDTGKEIDIMTWYDESKNGNCVFFHKNAFEQAGASEVWEQICDEVLDKTGVDRRNGAGFGFMIKSLEKQMHADDGFSVIETPKKKKKFGLNENAVKQIAFDLSDLSGQTFKEVDMDADEDYDDDDDDYYPFFKKTENYEKVEKEDIPKPELPEAPELTDEEKEHIAILDRLAKHCYSKRKSGFTEREKLDAIKEELKETNYRPAITHSNHYDMYFKKGFSSVDKSMPVFIVSSHADNVEAITKPYSKLQDNGWYLKGTYDNLGTNAASVILMKEHNIPVNVLFIFTANEESGGCTGLKQAVAQLRANGYEKLVGIALDVTPCAYDEGYLYSLENMSNDSFIAASYDAAIDMEPEGVQTFSVTPLSKSQTPSNLTKDYFEGDYGWYDEAMAFREVGVPACSVCLPTEGEMHSNGGILVKQPTFEGYLLSLTSFLYELTQTHAKKLEEFKEKRKALVEKNAVLVSYEEQMEKYERSSWGSYSGYSYGGYSSPHYYDDFELDEDGYDEEAAMFDAMMEDIGENLVAAEEELTRHMTKGDLDKFNEQFTMMQEDLDYNGSYYINESNFENCIDSYYVAFDFSKMKTKKSSVKEELKEYIRWAILYTKPELYWDEFSERNSMPAKEEPDDDERSDDETMEQHLSDNIEKRLNKIVASLPDATSFLIELTAIRKKIKEQLTDTKGSGMSVRGLAEDYFTELTEKDNASKIRSKQIFENGMVGEVKNLLQDYIYLACPDLYEDTWKRITNAEETKTKNTDKPLDKDMKAHIEKKIEILFDKIQNGLSADAKESFNMNWGKTKEILADTKITKKNLEERVKLEYLFLDDLDDGIEEMETEVQDLIRYFIYSVNPKLFKDEWKEINNTEEQKKPSKPVANDKDDIMYIPTDDFDDIDAPF